MDEHSSTVLIKEDDSSFLCNVENNTTPNSYLSESFDISNCSDSSEEFCGFSTPNAEKRNLSLLLNLVKNGDSEILDSKVDERDVIDGIVFLSFTSEQELMDYSRLQQDQRATYPQSDDGLEIMDDGSFSDISSSHAIVPTNTNDITRIEGWRNKCFTGINVYDDSGSSLRNEDDGFGDDLEIKSVHEASSEEIELVECVASSSKIGFDMESTSAMDVFSHFTFNRMVSSVVEDNNAVDNAIESGFDFRKSNNGESTVSFKNKDGHFLQTDDLSFNNKIDSMAVEDRNALVVFQNKGVYKPRLEHMLMEDTTQNIYDNSMSDASFLRSNSIQRHVPKEKLLSDNGFDLEVSVDAAEKISSKENISEQSTVIQTSNIFVSEPISSKETCSKPGSVNKSSNGAFQSSILEQYKTHLNDLSIDLDAADTVTREEIELPVVESITPSPSLNKTKPVITKMKTVSGKRGLLLKMSKNKKYKQNQSNAVKIKNKVFKQLFDENGVITYGRETSLISRLNQSEASTKSEIKISDNICANENLSQRAGLIVNIGFKRPLYKEVCDNIKSLITDDGNICHDLATLAVSAVQTPNYGPFIVTRFLVPVVNKNLKKLMCSSTLVKTKNQEKHKSSALQNICERNNFLNFGSSVLDKSSKEILDLATNNSVDPIICTTMDEILNYVTNKECFDTMQYIYDPDVPIPVEKENDDVFQSSQKSRVKRKKSRLQRQIEHLGGTFIAVQGEESFSQSSGDHCLKEYCSLGCVCPYKAQKEVHCTKETCMFSCKCPPRSRIQGSEIKSKIWLLPEVLRLKNTSQSKLAPVEREYHQTVIMSKDRKMITIETNRPKRIRKMPSKFKDNILLDYRNESADDLMIVDKVPSSSIEHKEQLTPHSNYPQYPVILPLNSLLKTLTKFSAVHNSGNLCVCYVIIERDKSIDNMAKMINFLPRKNSLWGFKPKLKSRNVAIKKTGGPRVSIFDSDQIESVTQEGASGLAIDFICSLPPEIFEKQDTLACEEIVTHIKPYPSEPGKTMSLINENQTFNRGRNEKRVYASLPVTETESKWWVVELDSKKFSVLKYYSDKRALKFEDMQRIIFKAEFGKTVFFIPLRKTVGNHRHSFGAYAVPGHKSLVFFGPYDTNERHGLIAMKLDRDVYSRRLFSSAFSESEGFKSLGIDYSKNNDISQSLNQTFVNATWCYSVRKEHTSENVIDSSSEIEGNYESCSYDRPSSSRLCENKDTEVQLMMQSDTHSKYITNDKKDRALVLNASRNKVKTVARKRIRARSNSPNAQLPVSPPKILSNHILNLNGKDVPLTDNDFEQPDLNCEVKTVARKRIRARSNSPNAQLPVSPPKILSNHILNLNGKDVPLTDNDFDQPDQNREVNTVARKRTCAQSNVPNQINEISMTFNKADNFKHNSNVKKYINISSKDRALVLNATRKKEKVSETLFITTIDHSEDSLTSSREDDSEACVEIEQDAVKGNSERDEALQEHCSIPQELLMKKPTTDRCPEFALLCMTKDVGYLPVLEFNHEKIVIQDPEFVSTVHKFTNRTQAAKWLNTYFKERFKFKKGFEMTWRVMKGGIIKYLRPIDPDIFISANKTLISSEGLKLLSTKNEDSLLSKSKAIGYVAEKCQRKELTELFDGLKKLLPETDKKISYSRILTEAQYTIIAQESLAIKLTKRSLKLTRQKSKLTKKIARILRGIPGHEKKRQAIMLCHMVKLNNDSTKLGNRRPMRRREVDIINEVKRSKLPLTYYLEKKPHGTETGKRARSDSVSSDSSSWMEAETSSSSDVIVLGDSDDEAQNKDPVIEIESEEEEIVWLPNKAPISADPDIEVISTNFKRKRGRLRFPKPKRSVEPTKSKLVEGLPKRLEAVEQQEALERQDALEKQEAVKRHTAVAESVAKVWPSQIEFVAVAEDVYKPVSSLKSRSVTMDGCSRTLPPDKQETITKTAANQLIPISTSNRVNVVNTTASTFIGTIKGLSQSTAAKPLFLQRRGCRLLASPGISALKPQKPSLVKGQELECKNFKSIGKIDYELEGTPILLRKSGNGYKMSMLPTQPPTLSTHSPSTGVLQPTSATVRSNAESAQQENTVTQYDRGTRTVQSLPSTISILNGPKIRRPKANLVSNIKVLLPKRN